MAMRKIRFGSAKQAKQWPYGIRSKAGNIIDASRTLASAKARLKFWGSGNTIVKIIPWKKR